MTFTEKLLFESITESLLEALKIKKKGDGVSSIDKRQAHLDKIHDLEIKQAKDQMAKLTVGVTKGITVIKSPHATEIRDGEKSARDAGIENKFLLGVIEKVMKSPNFKPGRIMVSYKNPKKKYDLMALGYDKNKKTITIITLIKKNKPKPYDAFSTNSEHDEAGKVMIEALQEKEIEELVELDFIPESLIIVD